MRFILTFLLLLSYSNSFSCYNEYYALDAKGRVHPVEINLRKFKQTFNKQYLEKQLAYLGIKMESPESEIKSEKVDSPKEAASKPKKKSDNSILLLGLTLVTLIVAIFTYFKTRKRK